MTPNKTIYYFFPVLLAILMFSSNFLSTNLFKGEVINFAVWFILSIFAFSCGWIITKTLDWVKGGKIVFTVIVVTSFITVIFVTLFHNYFNLSGVLTENLILYSLRNIYIGLMAFFGMSVSHLFEIARELETYRALKQKEDEILKNAADKAELIVAKAKLEAEQILFDAKRNRTGVLEAKEIMEKKLREFIDSEKELLNNYKDNK